MKAETILPIASFLAKTWSDDTKLEVKLEKNTVPRSYKDKKLVIVGYPEDYRCTQPIYNYRLWRVSLWHEAMHVKYSPLIHGFNTVIHQAIEDYRVEHLGLKEYPGMKNELEFSIAMHYYVILPAKTNVDAFVQKLLLGTVKLDEQSEVDMSKVDEAVNYTITKLEEHNYRCNAEVVRRIAKKVAEILGVNLDDYTIKSSTRSQPIKLNFQFFQRIKQEEVREAVEKYVEKKETNNKGNVSKNESSNEREGNRGGDEDAKTGKHDVGASKDAVSNIDSVEAKVEQLLKPGEDVEREFAIIKQEEKKEEKKDMEGIYIPRRLHVEYYIYDQQLINHLVSVFSRLRRGWMEYSSTHGGEFDVENYLTTSKPFTDEKRMKNKGIKVIILLDLSGSIRHHNPYKYKTVCISIAEALNKLGIKFAVYAFNTTDTLSNPEVRLWQIKGEKELWTKMSARRLAQLNAEGCTPMKEIYERLEKVLRNAEKVIMFTITDGVPTDKYGHTTAVIVSETAKVIQRMKRFCKMYAIAIGKGMFEAVDLAYNLSLLGYDRYVATDDLRQLPAKVFKMIQEEVMSE
jgi:Mg-chelatase subunit ChlD